MPCYDVPCYAMPCYAMLLYPAVHYCIVPCRTKTCHTLFFSRGAVTSVGEQ